MPTVQAVLPGAPGMPLTIREEAKRNHPYLDAIGIPTQGIGATRGLDGQPVKITDLPWTDEQVLFVFRRDWLIAQKGIDPLIEVELSQNQRGALGSWVFNLGEHRLKASTLRHEINDENEDAVEAEWMKWDRAGGKELEGLHRRRQHELDLWEAA